MTLLAAGVSGYALSSALVPGLRTPFVQALFDQKTLRAFGHLLGGGTSILAGAFQFNATLRNRRPAVHRLLGRIYLVAVAVSGVSALMLAPTSSGGMTAHVGFGLLAVGWLATSGVAYRQVRAGEYELHRQWMMRGYALCLAAVTLRLVSGAEPGDGRRLQRGLPHRRLALLGT
jgi:uncharacterized membrane protein